MISPDSFHSDGATCTRVLDALEGQQTDTEFREMIEKNRFLAICKQKGFKHLDKLGVTKQKDEVPTRQKGQTKREFVENAAIKAVKIYESGLSILETGKAVGISPITLAATWKRMKITPKMRGQVGEELNVDRILDLCNKQGYSARDAAEAMGRSSTTVRLFMRKNGYAYCTRSRRYV